MVARQRSQETVERLFFPENLNTEEIVPEIAIDLDLLFSSKVMGFRELLATIVYAKLLDLEYSPREDLYESNPRSLYEKGLKPVFDSRGIPSGQSGPLNIAKATASLNEQWAAQRRPQAVANALLKVVDWIMLQSEETIVKVAAEVGRRFDLLAEDAEASKIVLASNTSSVSLAAACSKLIQNHTLRGEIPQILCGIALETEFLASESTYVDGARDSSSATNRTSNKVGDITVEKSGGEILRVYEITVKAFSSQRLREAVQSIRAFYASSQVPEDFVVLVLCRRSDVPSEAQITDSNSLLGELEVSGIVFEFLDIHEWLTSKITEFSVNHRRYFFDEVTEYLNGARIPAEVRACWQSDLAGPPSAE